MGIFLHSVKSASEGCLSLGITLLPTPKPHGVKMGVADKMYLFLLRHNIFSFECSFSKIIA